MPKRVVTDVIEDIVDIIAEAEEPLSTREIAKKKSLDWEATDKYLTMLSKIARRGTVKLVAEKPNVKLWKFERKPEERRRYLREKYFPEPEEEDFLYAEMLKAKATSPETAIRLKETPLLKQQLDHGQIAKAGGRYYLTDEGVKVAEGTLKLYPELV